MTVRETGPVLLGKAPDKYDPREEAQNRRNILDAINRIGRTGVPSAKGLVYIASPMDYGAVGDGTTDDVAAVQACADDIDAKGGGAMWLDRWYYLNDNVTITNKVSLFGIGPTMCGFTTNSAFTMSVTGGPLGWRYGIEGIGFTKIDLNLGAARTDYALGFRVVDCVFDHCNTGIYLGWNAFYCEITGCHFVDTATGIYFDGAAAGASSGVSNRIVNCAFFNSGDTGLAQVGIYFDPGVTATVTAGSFVIGHTYSITTVGTTDFTLIGAASNTVGVWFTATGVGAGTGTATLVETPWDFHITSCHFEDCAVAGIQVVNGHRRSYLFIRNSQFARMNGSSSPGGYAVENDNSVIWVDKCVAWTDTVLFYNIDGRITITGLTCNWQDNKLAKIDAGEVRVDAATNYIPNEAWGPSYAGEFAPPSLAGSTAGTGALVALRTPTLTRYDGYTTQMTPASTIGTWKATGNNWLVAEAGDGNVRIWDFCVDVTAIGTDNYLRIQLIDGTVSPYVDLGFPLIEGLAVIRAVWIPSVTLTIHGIYSETFAGGTDTVTRAFYQQLADTTNKNAIRYVQFQTINYGLTPSTMQVKNLTELTSGPYTAAT